MKYGRRLGHPGRSAVVWTMTLALAATLASGARAQDDGTRHIWETALLEQSKSPATRKSPRKTYRVLTPRVPLTGVSGDTVIGVTLWRLRSSRATDSGERAIVHDDASSIDWVPERVSSTGRLTEGDRIRLSIEAARTGYLYVVDEEQYADGSRGEPHLIFPTTRTRGGDNSVKSGWIVEIPAQDDRPPYFTLKRTRVDHVGEVVSVLVSPTPIEGLTITDQQQSISPQTLATWQKSWGAQGGRLEMQAGAGRPWTRQEKEAGADGTRALTKDAPPPQTIYYRPGATSATPVLVEVKVRYAGRATR